jgi:hypothetical protein
LSDARKSPFKKLTANDERFALAASAPQRKASNVVGSVILTPDKTWMANKPTLIAINNKVILPIVLGELYTDES